MRKGIILAALVAAFSCPAAAQQLYCHESWGCFAWPPAIGLQCDAVHLSTVPCPSPTPTPTPTPTPASTPTPTPTPTPIRGGDSVPVSFDPGMTKPCFVRATSDDLAPPLDIARAATCEDGGWLVAGSRQWGQDVAGFQQLAFNHDPYSFLYWNRTANGGIDVTLGLREDGLEPEPYTWAMVAGTRPASLGQDLWLELTLYYADSRYQWPGGSHVSVQTGAFVDGEAFELDIDLARHNLWFGPWPGQSLVCSQPGEWDFIGLSHYCVVFGDGLGYAAAFSRTVTLNVPIAALYRTTFPTPAGGWGAASLYIYGVALEVHGHGWAFATVSDLTLWRGYPHATTSTGVRRHLQPLHEPAPPAPGRNQ